MPQNKRSLPEIAPEIAPEIEKLQALRKQAQSRLLALYKKANAGHIGSSLSCLDLLLYLFHRRMDRASRPNKRPDELILSKGHAAGALYVALAQSGNLDPELLDTFYQDGSLLAAHTPCSRKFEAIPFGTGSLGHGLSLATGIALAQKYVTAEPERRKQVYAILSDGDCNEGSTWEAVLFAGHHKLSNLVVIVDANGLQGLGPTREILDLEPFLDKWKAFRFDTYLLEDGNDFAQIEAVFKQIDARASRPPSKEGDATDFNNAPVCIVARTTKGAGISYMENRFEWHYLPMTDAEYAQALEEVNSRA